MNPSDGARRHVPRSGTDPEGRQGTPTLEFRPPPASEQAIQEADVVVRQQSDCWVLLRDGHIRGMFSTRDEAIGEGRALIQRDRTTLWLQSEQGLREVGSYRICRSNSGTSAAIRDRAAAGPR